VIEKTKMRAPFSLPIVAIFSPVIATFALVPGASTPA
jgi:hypothetical protein